MGRDSGNGTCFAGVSTLVTSTVKFVRQLFLIGSLAGLLIGTVMACIPPELYTTLRHNDDEMTSRLMWIALIVLSVSGLVTTAVLYTIKTPQDDEGPMIIRR